MKKSSMLSVSLRLTSIILFSFASHAAVAQSMETPSVPTQVATTLTFLDSKLFDNQLSKELSAEKDVVEVTISGKMSLNSIPGRIDKWITVVGENGEVSVVASEPTLKPKFVGALLSLIPTVFSFMKKSSEERTLEPAKKYNAIVTYQMDRNGESMIEKIVFTKKK
ncbi:MAG: hypothetical protein Q8Q55_00535 [Undibacterium sp.]|nr:hypothetical protein [Undibacterium sp.]